MFCCDARFSISAKVSRWNFWVNLSFKYLPLATDFWWSITSNPNVHFLVLGAFHYQHLNTVNPIIMHDQNAFTYKINHLNQSSIQLKKCWFSSDNSGEIYLYTHTSDSRVLSASEMNSLLNVINAGKLNNVPSTDKKCLLHKSLYWHRKI